MEEGKTIEITKASNGAFDVRHDGKTAKQLSYSGMVGLVSQITMPQCKSCLSWLRPDRTQVEANAEPATKSIDPGEGYRLIDPKVDKPESGDEFYCSSNKRWEERADDTWDFMTSDVYRRKLPVEAKVGDWVVYRGWEPKRVVSVNQRGAVWSEGLAGGLLPHGEYNIVDPPNIPSIGDWVRIVPPWCNHEKGPFQVIGLTEDGKPKVAFPGDYGRVMHPRHSYEIVRKVIKPWTMIDACTELANAEMVVRWNGQPLTVHNIRAWSICCKEGHAPSYEKMASSTVDGSQVWTLPNGDPCGNIAWQNAE